MKPSAGKSKVFAANTYNRAQLLLSMALALSGELNLSPWQQMLYCCHVGLAPTTTLSSSRNHCGKAGTANQEVYLALQLYCIRFFFNLTYLSSGFSQMLNIFSHGCVSVYVGVCKSCAAAPDHSHKAPKPRAESGNMIAAFTTCCSPLDTFCRE